MQNQKNIKGKVKKNAEKEQYLKEKSDKIFCFRFLCRFKIYFQILLALL